jgi:hypothetical protein
MTISSALAPSVAARSNAALATLFALLFGALLCTTGCSMSAMHGYDVVRSDMHVEYEHGPLGLETTAGGESSAGSVAAGAQPFDREAFGRAMHASLTTSAPDFTLVDASQDPPHILRVAAIELTPSDEGTRVRGGVEIVDRNGVVTSELAIELTVPRGEDAAAHAGEAFGARVGHYIENRENYHW